MRTTNPRIAINFAFCLFLFFALGVPTQGRSEEYYIYRSSTGKLVISNNQPPPGSTIIKQQSLPERTDSQVQRSQEQDDIVKRRLESSPEPSRQTEENIKAQYVGSL